MLTAISLYGSMLSHTLPIRASSNIEIINTLKSMDMRKIDEYGYIPCYTRTELTDAIHENAGIRTDYELTTPKSMAGIIRRTKGL